MKYSKLLAALMLAFALTACGGGGGEPTQEQLEAQAAENKMLADVGAIQKKITACQCAGEDPMFTRPDVVTDEDLLTLMRYAQWLMGGNQQQALALLSHVNAAIEYRKKQAAPVAMQPSSMYVVVQ